MGVFARAALRALALALGLLAAWPALAQGPTELVLGDDHLVRIHPGEPTALTLDDPAGSLTLSQVQQAMAAQPALPGGVQGTCATTVCWMQVRLRSGLALDTQFSVWTHDYSDYVDLYVVGADGRVVQLRQMGALGHAPSSNDSHYAMFTLRRGETVTLYAHYAGTPWFRFKPDRGRRLRPNCWRGYVAGDNEPRPRSTGWITFAKTTGFLFVDVRTMVPQ